MTQSGLIVGLCSAGFLLYLAAKGRLPVYTAVVWGRSASGGGMGGGAGGGSGDVNTEDAAKIAAQVLPYFV